MTSLTVMQLSHRRCLLLLLLLLTHSHYCPLHELSLKLHWAMIFWHCLLWTSFSLIQSLFVVGSKMIHQLFAATLLKTILLVSCLLLLPSF